LRIKGILSTGCSLSSFLKKIKEKNAFYGNFLSLSKILLIRWPEEINLRFMGYVDKLQQICSLRGMDQATLAQKVGISKSSMSRILSGLQEPKLRLAYDLAQALGVSLDSLINDDLPLESVTKTVPLSEDQLTILNIVERLGYNTAIDRLLAVSNGHATQGNAPVSEAIPTQSQGTRSAVVVGVVASNHKTTG